MVSFVRKEIVDVAIYSSLFKFSFLGILLSLQHVYARSHAMKFLIIWEVLKVILKNVQAKLSII